ncbi:MAG: cadherin-like domain-containing protein [Acidobacteria bacterium]|nr:cadherin-like domain-containing protein [Acidobacteriota bacterium]
MRAFFVDGTTLYVGLGSGGGIFVSTNNGQSWTVLNNGLVGSTLNINSILFFSGRLYAATQGGVCRYVNGAWVTFNTGLTNVDATTFLVYGGRLYVGTRGAGLFLLGSGNNWIPFNNGLPNTGLPSGAQVLALANAGAAVYAGLNGGGLHISRNSGQMWAQVAGGFPSTGVVNSIWIDGMRYYVATSTGVYVTNDSGATWNLLSNGLSGCNGANDVNVVHAIASRLLVGTTNCGVYGSALVTGQTNRAPIAYEQTLAYTEDTPVTINLNGLDADVDPLTYSIVASPTRGSLSGSLPNITYTPNAHYNGRDAFTFRVNDGRANSNSGTISLEGRAVNDTPVLNVPGAQTVVANQTLSFTVSATDPDVGQSITLSAANLPQGATFNPATGAFGWTPVITQVGVVVISFTAADSVLPSLSQTKTVLINIVPPPNIPNGLWSQYNVGLESAGVAYGFASVGNKLFAKTEKGIYRLETNGWQLFSNGLPAVTVTSPQARLIYDLTAEGGTLYALLKDGLYRSTNLGVNWTKLSLSSLPALSANAYVMGIRGQVVLIAGQFSTSFFQRSTDSGVVFAAVGREITASLPNQAISAGAEFFIATSGNLLRSAGDGSFSVVTGSGLTGVIYCLTASGQTLFAGTNTGVFRSIDNGATWTQVSSGLSATLNVTSLHYQSPFLVAGTTQGIYYSLNHGGNWTLMNMGDVPPRAESLFAFDGKLWAASGMRTYGTTTYPSYQGVYVSPLPTISSNTPPTITVNDSYSVTTGGALNFNVTAAAPETGQSVTLSAVGLPAGATFSPSTGTFSWTPLAPGTYFATFNATDNGAPIITTSKAVAINVTGANLLGNWVFTSALINHERFLSVKGLTAIGNDVYAAINSTLYRSRDGGAWRQLPVGGEDIGDYVASISAANGALYVSTRLFSAGGSVPSGVGFFVSKDDGNSWMRLNPPSLDTPVGKIFGASNNLVTFIGSRRFISKDEGQTWTSSTPTLPNDSFGSLVQKGNSLFLGGKGATLEDSILRSDDYGATWLASGGGIPTISGLSGPFALTVKGTELLAVGVNTGVLRSADNGTTWTFANGSGNAALTITPSILAANQTHMFVSSHQFSMDNGASWLFMNSGFNVGFIGTSNSIAVTDTRIYAATSSRIYGSNLPGTIR